MKAFTPTLAGALHQMLDESGMDQKAVAERAEISKGSVTNYVKGRYIPKWRTVQEWARVCGFNPDDATLRRLWNIAKNGHDPDGGSSTLRPRQDSNLRPLDYTPPLLAAA